MNHPVEINFNGSNVFNAIQWCIDNISNEEWEVITHWPREDYDFYFNKSSDAVWFSLSWVQ